MLLSQHYSLEFQILNKKLSNLRYLKSKLLFQQKLKRLHITCIGKHKSFSKLTEFWSKYLFFVWFSFWLFMSLFSYQVFFDESNLMLKIFFISMLLINTSLSLIVFMSATLVYNETNKTYGIVNTLMITCNEINGFNLYKFKVSHFYHI